MKTINKDELFHNLSGFLKSKGIDLNEGTYTTRIKKSCNLLSDAINATQNTVKRTKVHVDGALDKLRQTIHEHTAPETPSSSAGSSSTAGKSAASGAKQSATTGTKAPAARAKPRRRKRG